jgi:hypothetical protein
MPPQKKAAPPLSLPERPPSKVEQGLQGAAVVSHPADGGTQDDADRAIAKAESPEALRERAIEAMVAAGLSRELAEATFVLAEQGNGTADDAAEIADAVAELVAEDHGQPLCQWCFPPTWAEVPAKFAGVSCVHGNWTRKPKA